MPAERPRRPARADQRVRTARKALLLGALVAAMLALVYLTPLREVFLPERIDAARQRIRELGALAPLVFVCATALAVTFGAPRLWFAAVGGMAFGWLSGAALAQVGTLAGCWLTFRAARALGNEFVQRRVGEHMPRLEKLIAHVGEHGILANVLLRAQPVGNCFVMNTFMGVTPIRDRAFLIGTFLGTLPETVIYALFGSGLGGELAFRVGLGIFLLVCLGITTTWLTRRHRSRLSNSD